MAEEIKDTAWELSGFIKDWSSEGALTFAPYLDVVSDLHAAVTERTLINDIGVVDPLPALSALPFSPHLEGRPSIGNSEGTDAPEPAGSSVNRTGFGTLIALDRIIVGQWAKDDSFRVGDSTNTETVWLNYKDDDGDWSKNDLKDPPINWTRESLLEDLGQEEFIRLKYPIDPEDPFSSDLYYFNPIPPGWARQCFRLLNRMRWTKSRWAFLANPKPDSFYYKRSTGTDYNDAVNNWPDNWTLQVDTVIAGDYMLSEDGGKKLERVYISDAANHSYSVPTEILTRDDDLYVYTQTAGDRFHPDGNDWTADSWNLVTQFKRQNNFGKKFDYRSILSEAAPPLPIGVDSVGWFVDGRDSLGNPAGVAGWTVHKWNVEYGLTWVTDKD